MSESLIKTIRKNRELRVAIGERWKFIARRPTDMEAAAISPGAAPFGEICQQFVIGWEGLTQHDLCGDAVSDVFPEFHIVLWHEWIADRRELWQPIAEPIIDAYTAHRKALEDVAKNA